MPVTISPLNPFHFVKVTTLSPRYHSGTMYDTLQRHNFRKWEQKDRYYQKIERGARFRFHFNASSYTSVALIIRDSLGRQVLGLVPAATVDVPGNLDDAGVQYRSFYYKLADLSAITVDGYYDLYLAVNYAGGLADEFVFEPFWLKDKHPDTIAIEYTQAVNKDDFYFAGKAMRPIIQVEGTLGEYDPQSEDVIFDDQLRNPQLLDSEVYDGMKLRIGGNGRPVPDWMLRTLTHILGIDKIFINGIQYRRATGAKWEPTRDPSNPLLGAAIDLRLADNQSTYRYTNNVSIIFVQPGTYPYALQNVTIGGYTVLAAAVIHNSTEQAALITALNAALSGNELFGAVSQLGSNVVYTAGAGETQLSASASLYLTFFSFAVSVPASTGLTAFSFLMAGPGGLVIEWGDSTMDGWAGTPGITLAGTVTHNYPVAFSTSYTVKVWGTTQRLIISSSAVSGLSGTLPAALQELNVRYARFTSNIFDFTLLTPCAANLKQLVITDCAVTLLGWSSATNMPALRTINFSSNALTSTAFNNFLGWVVSNAGTYSIYGGTLSMVAQSSGTAYTTYGSFQRASLISTYGWTVNP